MSSPKLGRQVARFAAAGVINTAIDYVGFIALTALLQLPLGRSWIAKAISGSIAMLSSFVLNRRWVFRGTSTASAASARAQLLRFLVVTLIGAFVVQLGGTHLLSAVWSAPGDLAFRVVAALHLDGLLAQPLVVRTVAFAAATLASMTWNYLGYRAWVFAAPAAAPAAQPAANAAAPSAIDTRNAPAIAPP
jgi:putative flippase GtrA